jgi:hypothetical protein
MRRGISKGEEQPHRSPLKSEAATQPAKPGFPEKSQIFWGGKPGFPEKSQIFWGGKPGFPEKSQIFWGGEPRPSNDG